MLGIRKRILTEILARFGKLHFGEDRLLKRPLMTYIDPTRLADRPNNQLEAQIDKANKKEPA